MSISKRNTLGFSKTTLYNKTKQQFELIYPWMSLYEIHCRKELLICLLCLSDLKLFDIVNIVLACNPYNRIHLSVVVRALYHLTMETVGPSRRR